MMVAAVAVMVAMNVAADDWFLYLLREAESCS